MQLGRRVKIALGTSMLIIGLILLGYRQDLFTYFLFLVPVWFFSDSRFPIYTISFLLIFAGASTTLYTLLESRRKHSWLDALQNLFLLFVLWMDHQIMNVDLSARGPLEQHYGAWLIRLDGVLIISLAFLIPRLRGGSLSWQVVYWFYLCFGTLIFFGAFYPYQA